VLYPLSGGLKKGKVAAMAGLSETRNQTPELPSRSNEPWTLEEDNQLRVRMADGETARAVATVSSAPRGPFGVARKG
jgi:hypothetical protein